MRFFWFLVLLILLGGVGLFAWQNLGEVTLQFFDWKMSASLAALIGVVYLLGMLSGWTVLGILRRSLDRISGRYSRA